MTNLFEIEWNSLYFPGCSSTLRLLLVESFLLLRCVLLQPFCHLAIVSLSRFLLVSSLLFRIRLVSS